MIEVGDDLRRRAERDARRLLEITGNVGVAVEPAGIANRLGVQVFEANLNPETLGGLLMTPGEDPEIVLNHRDGLIRRRLTCAYELGHFVLRSADTTEYSRVDLRKHDAAPEPTRDQAYARRFAACLLMPDDVVRTLVELGMDDLEMAVWLVVSREAMQSRLDDLDLMNVAPRAA